MSFTVCKSGAYGLCNMDPFIEISLIIKYIPHAHFRVCKAPEAFPSLCIISTVSC